MLDHTAILLCFRQTVDAAEIPNLPSMDSRWAYVNHEFTPPNADRAKPLDCMWIREGYAPGEEVQSASDTVEGPGVYTLDILVPKGAGTSEIHELQKAISEALHPATTISNDDVEVAIDRTARSVGRIEDGVWYVVSVQSTWRCYDIGS